MDKPKISVIVPVYNVEKYLHRCIDSILSQTFTDFELLLIDDGSTDSSGKICDEYEKKDERIRVFHKENGGASSARNVGLKEAVGDWVAFCDSDDYVGEGYLYDLFVEIDRQTSLILQSPIYVSEAYSAEKKIFKKVSLVGKEGKRKFVNDGFLVFSEPHSKLFSMQIIKKHNLIFQNDVIIGEDGIFIADFLLHTDKIKIGKNSSYYYMKYENSVQSRLYSHTIEWNGFFKWKEALNRLCKQIDIEKDSPMIWRLLSVTLNRYIKSVCFNTNIRTSVGLLRKLSLSDKQNYGKGQEYSFAGNVFKFMVNKNLILLLIVFCHLYKRK